MTIFSKQITLVLGVGAAALIAATTWYHQYDKRKNNIPEKWVEIGSVGVLWIYPLKSGRAIELKEFDCSEVGPVLREENKFTLKDRGFLVYKEKDGEQRTARNYPNMVLITITAISEDEIRLDAPNVSPLIIKTSIEDPKLISCILHNGESQRCIDCGNDAAKWISQYCSDTDFGLRIGISAEFKRSIDVKPLSMLKGVYKNLKSADLGIYSDMGSYLICNRASVEDLNDKLPEEISPLYFRPNIVIDGPKTFAEDDWDWIKIGDNVIFRNVRPCTRCILVNLDPIAGTPLPQQAVLRKLREYRLVTDKKKREIEGNSPAMGIYVGLRKPGQIKVGDKVYIG